jgi:hypothetical protein
MARPTYFRRLEAWVRKARAENASRLIDVKQSNIHAFSPISVHLEAGQKAVPIPIENKFPGTGLNSWVLVAASAPGVVARLAQQNTSETCRDSGYLCRPQDGVFDVADQDGTVFPCFQTGKWQNNSGTPTGTYDAINAALVADPQGNFAQNVIRFTSVADDPTDYHGVARYYWGRDDSVDLGNPSDGKIFAFWVMCEDATLAAPDGSSSGIYIRSYPYTGIITDAEAEAGILGTPTDEIIAREGFTPGLHEYSGQNYFDRIQTANRWHLIVLDKSEFTTTFNGIWDRITTLEISHVHADNNGNAGYNSWLSSVYFGDPPWSKIDAVGLFPWRADQNQPAVLSLDAPYDKDVQVEAMVTLA